jgi:proteasome-associated ATPase
MPANKEQEILFNKSFWRLLMLKRSRESIMLQKILQSKEIINYEDEKIFLEEILSKKPEMGSDLAYYYFERSHHFRNELKKTTDEIESLKDSPWFPARCISLFNSDAPMAMVAIDNGRRAIVTIGEDVDIKKLNQGTAVLLNNKMNKIIRIWNDLPLNGEVAMFDRSHDGKIVVKTNSETELVLDLCQKLNKDTLRVGDPILFDRGSHIALEKISKPDNHDFYLEETPDVTFDDIGGLDAIIEELLDHIDLNFFYPEIVRKHRLRPAKGILLVGRPGLGKTMLAKAVANYCSSYSGSGQCKFMNIQAGSQRSWFYGGTEYRYRQIFAAAREAARENASTRVLIFFDELDNIGYRSQNFGDEIDSRTMTAFLAELDGLKSCDNIMVIGATNREDLIDPALKRPKRFGDKIFRISNPDRDACADILKKYLNSDLPYYRDDRKVSSKKIVEGFIETAVAYLYAPNSPRSKIATITFRNGSTKEIAPPDIISGALIENTVRKASYNSCVRALSGREGINLADVIGALDEELDSIAEQLENSRALRNWINIDSDLDVIRVEAHKSSITAHRYPYADAHV